MLLLRENEQEQGFLVRAFANACFVSEDEELDSDEEEESNELEALENLGASEWDDLLKDEK